MKKYISILLLLFMVCVMLVSCVTADRQGTLSNKNFYHIEDVEEYYKYTKARVEADTKEFQHLGRPIFILGLQNFQLIIIQEDSCYVAIEKSQSWRKSSLELDQDTIVKITTSKDLKFGLEQPQLKELFAWEERPEFFYDWAYSNKMYNPFFYYIALVDASGDIKLLATSETIQPTQMKFEENYNEEIPLTASQKEFLTKNIYFSQ